MELPGLCLFCRFQWKRNADSEDIVHWVHIQGSSMPFYNIANGCHSDSVEMLIGFSGREEEILFDDDTVIRILKFYKQKKIGLFGIKRYSFNSRIWETQACIDRIFQEISKQCTILYIGKGQFCRDQTEVDVNIFLLCIMIVILEQSIHRWIIGKGWKCRMKERYGTVCNMV